MPNIINPLKDGIKPIVAAKTDPKLVYVNLSELLGGLNITTVLLDQLRRIVDSLQPRDIGDCVSYDPPRLVLEEDRVTLVSDLDALEGVPYLDRGQSVSG